MKSFLVSKLIENSKGTKSVPGEMAKPGYDSLGTPDNHTTGKKNREVDAKNLGDYPVGTKKVSQVQPPKSRERRSMTENAVVDAVMGFMMKMSGPKFGRQLYDQLKQEEPELYKRLVDKFTGLVSRGNLTDRQMMAQLMVDHDAMDLAREIQAWVGDRMPPEFDDWADKKRAKLGMNEEFGDYTNSDAVPVTSKAKNKDEGMKKPAVVKAGAVARGSRIGTIGDTKPFDADIGKIRKLPDGYKNANSVAVAKLKEDLDELSEILGGLDLDPAVMDEVFENYPDDMSWSRFDAYMGDGSEDDDFDAIQAAIKEGTAAAVSEYSEEFVDAYLSNQDEDYLHDFYNAVMDAASDAEPSNDFYSDDIGLSKIVDQMVIEHLTSKGVGTDVIKRVVPVTTKVTEDDPCWSSHEQVGMKQKGGREVPNCVPKKKVGENASMGAVGSGSIPGTTAAGGTRHRSQLFADAPGGRDPDGIDFVPQDPKSYIRALDAYMDPTYDMTWDLYSDDQDMIVKVIKVGITPQELADAIARREGLTEAGAYDPYPGHLPMITVPKTYKDIAIMAKVQLRKSNGAAKVADIIRDLAQKFERVFGPVQNTIAQVMRYFKLLDAEDATEGAHDMMPRKTQHVDRAKAAGMKDADEILDPSSIPDIGGNGDPRANPMESHKPVSRYR